jgi:hypothetical protein
LVPVCKTMVMRITAPCIRFVHAHELNQGPLVQSTASGAAYLHDVLTHLPYAATSTTW